MKLAHTVLCSAFRNVYGRDLKKKKKKKKKKHGKNSRIGKKAEIRGNAENFHACWWNKALLMHAQQDSACDCVLHSVYKARQWTQYQLSSINKRHAKCIHVHCNAKLILRRLGTVFHDKAVFHGKVVTKRRIPFHKFVLWADITYLTCLIFPMRNRTNSCFFCPYKYKFIIFSYFGKEQRCKWGWHFNQICCDILETWNKDYTLIRLAWRQDLALK